MLSIYVHIPFCLKKCAYCDFYSVEKRPSDIPCDEYLASLKKQLDEDLKRFELGGREVTSIYFGGGTPSMMSPEFFNSILSEIGGLFRLNSDVEISCEVNPASVDLRWFEGAKKAGINRVTIGVQSFDDHLLKILGRIHDSEDAMRCIAESQESGFSNVGLDIIYGIPGEGMDKLEDDLKTAMTFQPTHVSAYALTVEDDTPLAKRIDDGESALPPDEKIVKQMRLVTRMLGRVGWKRYEISNFAKPGFESRHNINYWRYGEYLGLGAGATSFMRGGGKYGERWTIARDLESYLGGELKYVEDETLSREDAMFEFCFMGLRSVGGIDKPRFEELFDVSFDDRYGAVIEEIVGASLAFDDSRFLRLSDRGFELSNQVFQMFI